jgi:iron complex transport system substrate-binding protein
VGWDEVVAAGPDILVLMPCGFDIARTRTEMGVLTARPGWPDLPAVRRGRVFLTDASSYFNRPGPRLIEGLEMLASVIHPEVCLSPRTAGGIEQR